MMLLIMAILLGLIPAAIARSKGRSFFLWWIYGTALLIVALLHAIMMKADVRAIESSQLASGDNRKCPFCAEIIKGSAVVCRYCGRDLPVPELKTDNLHSQLGTRSIGNCPKCGTQLQDFEGKDYCSKCVLCWPPTINGSYRV